MPVDAVLLEPRAQCNQPAKGQTLRVAIEVGIEIDKDGDRL
jgi:hypothetical protein